MIRKARISDVEPIRELIRFWADRDKLLARSISDLCDNLRDFFVCERNGRVVGCAALHIAWLDLAEVRSVAVAEDHMAQGIGGELVSACLAEARMFGLPRAFTLTYIPKFFERFGFREVPKETFPHKIWTVCLHCPHYPDCDEVAMAVDLSAQNPG